MSERLAVDRVLRSGNLAQGAVVQSFEKEFSRLVEGRPCVAVNSGTSALHIALLALGIGPGDEVIVPSFTFAATANAVSLTGAKPVFVDINPMTYCLDWQKIEEAITLKTRAIQVVHLFGMPADMEKIAAIAKTRNLYLIEDAAQAHLAAINNKPVGSFGDAAIFSFYPTKNMTSGEGGMVVLNSEKTERTCRLLRNQGMEIRYQNEIIGFNLRMTEIHAAIGREQLRKLGRLTYQRQSNAEFFNQNLVGVEIPVVMEGYSHVYHQYTIRIKKSRDNFAEKLLARGVSSAVYYPRAVHTLPAFSDSAFLPETERAAKEVLSIPVHPNLSKRQLNKVVSTVNTLYKEFYTYE
jgi:perosamine synthetase